jgi:hypothetical protein
VESSCGLGNEPSVFMTRWETIEWLHNLWALEKLQIHRVGYVVR